MTKRKYLLTYYNARGEEDIIEIPAYSAEQAEELSGLGAVIAVEETVRKDYRPSDNIEFA